MLTKAITLKSCTRDCAYYRENPTTPAAEHVHFPTFILLKLNGDGTADVLVEPRVVDPSEALDVRLLQRDYPWFFGVNDRAPLAELVT